MSGNVCKYRWTLGVLNVNSGDGGAEEPRLSPSCLTPPLPPPAAMQPEAGWSLSEWAAVEQKQKQNQD